MFKSVMAIQNIYCAQESGGQGNCQKKSLFFICFRKSLVEQWEPAKYRRLEVILDRYQRLEADPVLRELPLHMACIKIYTG